MKTTTKAILLIVMLASLSLFNGCEELDIPLNIKFPVTIKAEGTDVPFYGEYKFCLNQYKDWEDNKDKIQSVKFHSAAFWTTDYKPDDLIGTITASLTDKNGIVLFSESLPKASPADFESPHPYKFELTKDEIDDFNAYLNKIIRDEDSECAQNQETFTAILTITDVTGNDANYKILGKVEIVLETEISPD